MTARASAARAARAATRELARLSRDPGGFDASRYFRADETLRFYNVGTPKVRALARAIHREHLGDWAIADALAFADAMIRLPHLEAKGVGIEVLAGRREAFAPAHLPAWKRWLAAGYAANWATTDAICGYLIGPLLYRHRQLVAALEPWRRHRVMWVRRAAAVALVGLARKGVALDEAYATAAALHADSHDLMHKAVGWLLREAGKTDMPRLERYLRDQGARMPRTTVRYAIERFPPPARAALLAATRG